MKRCRLILLLAMVLLVLPAVLAEQTLLTTTVPAEHTLSISCPEHGTIAVNGVTLLTDEEIPINRHDLVLITFMPDPGYELESAVASSDYGVTLEDCALIVNKMVQDLNVKLTFTQSRLPGDANEDGLVDIFDALLILQYDVGWDVTINTANADVNASGTVDIFDALLILQYDVGWDVALI